jgi:hypothetical protein
VADRHRQSAGILGAIHPVCRTRSTVGSGMLRNISWRTRTSLCQEDHRDADLPWARPETINPTWCAALLLILARTKIETENKAWSNNLLIHDDRYLSL